MYKEIKTARPRGTDGAKAVLVIETEALRGCGTEDDPCRIVRQYWSLEGELLAQNDPCIEDVIKAKGYLRSIDRASSTVDSSTIKFINASMNFFISDISLFSCLRT